MKVFTKKPDDSIRMTPTKSSSKTMRIDLIPEISDVPLGDAPTQVVVSATSRLSRSARESGILGTEYRDFFQSVYDAGVITSSTGRILDVNRRAVDFFQYSLEEFCAFHVSGLISGADDALLETLHANLENERFTLIQAYCMRKNMEFFPAEIAVSRIRLGEIRHLCFFMRDITIRRRAEDMLRTEHQAIQNASGGIAVTDGDGVLEYVNPAVLRMWRCTEANEVVGHHFQELMQEGEAAANVIHDVLESQSDWRGEMTACTVEGRFFPVDVSAICNRNSDGDVVGVVLSLADLTDHRVAENARQDADRQRVMFESLGTVCHHLGQPMTVISGVLDILESSLAVNNPKSAQLLGMAQEACQSLSVLMQRLREVQEYRPKTYLATAMDGETSKSNILDI